MANFHCCGTGSAEANDMTESGEPRLGRGLESGIRALLRERKRRELVPWCGAEDFGDIVAMIEKGRLVSISAHSHISYKKRGDSRPIELPIEGAKAIKPKIFGCNFDRGNIDARRATSDVDKSCLDLGCHEQQEICP